MILADPNVEPNAQQIESIQVLGKFYQNDLTKATDALNSIKECCPDAFPNICTFNHHFVNSSGDNVHQRTTVFNITQAENVFAKHSWYHPHEWPRFAKHL